MVTVNNMAYLDGTGYLDTNGNWQLVTASTPLPITGSISATNPSVGTTNTTAPTSATEIGIIDGTGKLQGVSSTNPVPISGSITASNPSVGTTGTTAPTSATEIGVINGSGQLTGVTLGQATSANSIPVVVASNNSINTLAGQASPTTGTITTSSSVVSENVSAYSVATVAIQGTYAGVTVNFEESPDGTNWYPVLGSDSSSAANAVSTVALGTNASKLYNFSLPGVTNFRVRASAYTSGTANVTIIATGDSMVFNSAVGLVGNATVVGAAASGASKSGNPVQIGAVFNTTQPTVTTGQMVEAQATSRGAQIVATGVDTFNVTAVGAATGSAVPSTAFYQGVIAETALPTAATAGNLTGMMADKFGRVVTSPYGPRGVIGAATTTITSSTAATTIIAAVASQFSDIVMIALTNTSATATTAILSDGTNSYELYAPATDVRGFTTGVILPATTANVAWTVQCGTSVASLFVTAIYVKNQ